MSQTDAATLSEEIHGYHIAEQLGASGLSTVFRAVEPRGGATVALRVLQPRFAGDPTAIAAFCHHARVAGALDHPGVAKMLDMHLDSPPYCFAMQWASGGTLAERLRSGGALPAGEAVAMWVELCAAVGHAHERGIAHGNITPCAILFDGEGNPVLTGFGLSGELKAAAALGVNGGRRSAAYASSEQLRGRAGSKRGDVYSLAAVLYEALTGRPPVPEAVGWRRRLPPPSAISSGVGPRLDAVVRRGLAPRWFRYTSTSGLSEALFDAMANPSPDVTSRKRVKRLVIAGMVAVSIIGVAGVYYSGSSKPGRMTSHATPYSPLGPAVHATGLMVSSGPGDGQAPGAPGVISVLGEDAGEAKRALTAAGLVMVVGDKCLHDHVPVGHVIWQNPRPGEDPLPGNMVRVQLSLGRGVKVPPLARVSAREAEQRLERIGLRPRVTRRWANTRKDAVISSYPGEGMIVATGSLVQLVVSKGRQQGGQAAGGTAYGLLSVSAGPSGSQIWLYVDGGNTRGRCPQTIRVTAGTHRVVLWDPEHGKQMTFTVEVDGGRTTSILRTLH